MSLTLRTSACFLALLVLGLASAGCGGGMVKPSGKVVKDGGALTLSDKGNYIIQFVPEGGGGQVYGTDANKDGTFTVSGKGMPPGKYKVVVQAMDPYPTKDVLGGKFTAANTPITREVTSNAEIVIDVAKAGG